MLLLIHYSLLLPLYMVLCVLSNLVIILLRKRDMVALPSL